MIEKQVEEKRWQVEAITVLCLVVSFVVATGMGVL